MPKKLSPESLENLAIAVVNLRTEGGFITNLQLSDVLQQWVIDIFPYPIGKGTSPDFKLMLNPGRKEDDN